MIATLVYIEVKPDCIQQFIEATAANHKMSILEKGNLRFDVNQDAADASKFLIYEAYQSIEAVNAHKETEHYKLWRDTVAEFMAKPREGVRYHILFPQH